MMAETPPAPVRATTGVIKARPPPAAAAHDDDPAPAADDAARAAPRRYVPPRAWAFSHVGAQLVVLLVAGAGLLLCTWRAPVYQALFDHVPDLALGPLLIEADWALPLVAPFALGLVLVLSRHRAPLLLWLAIMATLAVLAVIETSRLNWYAFSRGIAYRLESGPVPTTRTIGGLVLLLSGAVLLAQQSVRISIQHLAARGVAREALAESRTGLLRLERLVAIGALGAGLVLTAVVTVSLRATEGAPTPSDDLYVPLVVAAALVGLLLGAIAWAIARRPTPPAARRS